MSLANHAEVTQYIEPGERIAQIVIEESNSISMGAG